MAASRSSESSRRPSPERSIEFPAKDVPLREDVSFLGALVGRMIAEQGGDDLFSLVEAIRFTAIRRREAALGGDAEGARAAGVELVERLESLEPERAEELVRSFSTYFRVVNLAEQVHRIRRRRELERSGRVQEESLAETLDRLLAGDAEGRPGLGRDGLQALLESLTVEPVFTAHPTEATRRALLEKDQRIARALVERLDGCLTPSEERQVEERIRDEVTAGWQTAEQAPERPTVLDEVEHVLFYLGDVIYRVVPVLYEELEEALSGSLAGSGDEPGAHSGAQSGPRELPTLVRFASWVGGDMDGNPAVGADTFRAALDRQRQTVLVRYHREVLELGDRLTQGHQRVSVSGEVLERLGALAERFPEAVSGVPERHRDMIYRIFLRLVAVRLEATLMERSGGYEAPGELLGDLRAVADSLASHGGEHAGLFRVRRLIRRLETFGFHMATLDLRQDARVLRRAVGRLLAGEDAGAWSSRSAEERAEAIREALREGRRPVVEADGDGPLSQASGLAEDRETARAVEVFEAAGEALHRHGRRAVGPFVISMASGADDVLSVLLLARWAGLAEGDAVPLDVAPLFETVEDLEAAPGILAALAEDRVYREHLMVREDRQMVMIGYSDSGKDGGLAASRWALQRAQERVVETLSAWGVEVTVFHGRGGTVSRGGGKLFPAVLAAPEGSVGGRLRWTEQGEVIDSSYGLRGIAVRTLERAVGAAALATARDGQGDGQGAGGSKVDENGGAPSVVAGRGPWREAMDVVAREGRRAWRGLVYEDERFGAFFRGATPIDVIERLPIGSRPSSRPDATGEQGSGGASEMGLGRLRAIPWVFSWTQSRFLLPGWYGLGTGLEAAAKAHGWGVLEEMAGEWPFFANLVGDVEMVLAKADLEIAGRYAELAGEAGEALFPGVEAEHARTVAAVLRLRKAGVLLEEEATLRRSIRLRNPYVDPMSFLQVELLGRWREAGRPDGELLEALFATVRGIAQGLRNTG